MAINRHGVVATVLNRPGTLGPAEGKRSRGDLPLLALHHRTARGAAESVTALPAADWRPFHMVIADAESAFFVAGLGEGRSESKSLGEGVSMVTAQPPNDLSSPRTSRHLPRFRAAAPPIPETGDWSSWEALLADSEGATAEALNVRPLGGFGTVCSSLLGLAADGSRVWRFAPGPPDRVAFHALPGQPPAWHA